VDGQIVMQVRDYGAGAGEAAGGKELVAIAMTGFGMEEDVSRSTEAGFSEHLTKPINFQRLESVIQNIASGSYMKG